MKQDAERKQFDEILARMRAGMTTDQDAERLRTRMLRAWDNQRGERNGR